MPKICLMCGNTFPDATTFCPTDGSALRATVQGDDLIGELVAERYLITDLISQGGMGEVYLASDIRLPQQFAIKVLRRQQTPDPSLIQRFRQEAEAVCRINHDRVARVYDFGFMVDDRAYIVMEYVAGKTLKQVVEERGALDPSEAAKIIQMAAEGIDAAHRLGIVHRDLKPENVMILDDAGVGTRVKVLDFGIAKLQDAEANKGYTQPGFVIGTPAWMSPEQLLGEPLDARSDVYALGLVAFALLTGEHAFTGVSEQAEMLARVSVPARSLSDVRPDVAWPPALLQLFTRTLARNAVDRPATAGQFAAAMLSAVPASARSVTPARTKTPVSAKVSTNSLDVANAPQRSKAWMYAVGGAVVVVMGVVGVWWQQSQGAKTNGGDAAGVVPGPTVVKEPEPRPPTVDSADAQKTPEQRVPSVSGNTSTNPQRAIDSTAIQRAAALAGNPGARQGGAPPPVIGALPESKTPAASSSERNEELKRTMEKFNDDNTEKGARETIIAINVLFGRLRNTSDQAWAQITLGMAYLTVREKGNACAAFERAGQIGAAIELIRLDSEEKRTIAGCPP